MVSLCIIILVIKIIKIIKATNHRLFFATSEKDFAEMQLLRKA